MDSRIISCGNDSLIRIWLTDDPSVETLSKIRVINQAREIVDSLFDEVLIKDKVVARLKLETIPDEDVRQAALRLADTRGDEPIKHNIRAWRVVSIGNHDIADYQRALRMSEAACGLEPDNRSFRNTLGVAQYRVGLHEEALATLCSSGDMAICISECEEAYDMGIIAMALHKVGQLERAKTAYQKLLELIKEKKDSDAQLTRFRREAEELIMSSRTPS